MKLEFQNVSQYKPNSKSSFLLREIHFSIEDKQNLAILTHQESTRILITKLILDSFRPDRGKIIREGSFSAPLGESGFFHGDMTAEENIRFACKIYGKPSKPIIQRIANLTELGKTLKKKSKLLNLPEKRKITLSLNLYLELDLYLIRGDAGHPEEKFQRRFNTEFASLLQKSTFITVSKNMKTVNKIAKSALVIDNYGEATFHEALLIGKSHYNELLSN